MISFFRKDKDKEKEKKKSKKSTKLLDKVVLPISLNRGKINKRLNGKVQKGGITLWYKDGLLHNVTGPAIIWEDGSYQWYFNGIIHRENGPAATSGNNKYWYYDGKRHRLDGPAVEFENGKKEWWIDGEELSEEDYLIYLNEKNKKSF